MNALQRGKNLRFYGYQSRCSTTELEETYGSYGYAIILGSYKKNPPYCHHTAWIGLLLSGIHILIINEVADFIFNYKNK